MYKIKLTTDKVDFFMPKENHESLFKACDYADIYKKHNPKAHYSVINDESGDVEYEV